MNGEWGMTIEELLANVDRVSSDPNDAKLSRKIAGCTYYEDDELDEDEIAELVVNSLKRIGVKLLFMIKG